MADEQDRSADAGDAASTEGGTDHHGQDGGRDTESASEAQRTGGLGSAASQDLPAMAQNNATVEEKLSGIVEQTGQDMAGESGERIEEVLRQRLRDSGIDADDDRLRDLVSRVRHPHAGGGGV